MSNLLRDFNVYIESFKEHKRLIERERYMLDRQKIILISDFFESAVQPVIKSDKRFSNIFGRDGYRIVGNLNQNSNNISPIFSVPHGLLSEAAQKRDAEYREKRIQEVLNATRVMRVVRDKVPMTGDNDERMQALEDQVVDRINSIKEEESSNAVYLEDMVDSMDSCAGFLWMQGIEHYETSSLIRGKGRATLQFWRDVNNLEDYGEYFPDKPPPKGG